MTEINWLLLPDHSWEQIFSLLDVKSLLQARETCRKFAEIFETSSRLCNKIRLKVECDENVTSQIKTLMKSRRKYRNLSIKGSMIEPGEMLPKILSSFKNLKNLSIDRAHKIVCNDEGYFTKSDDDGNQAIEKLKHSFDGLEELELNSCDPFLLKAFENVSNLRKLVY